MRGGAGLPTQWFYYVRVLLGDDTRWSSKLARSNVTKARRTARRWRRVSDKGGGESVTKVEASQRRRRRRVSDEGGGESATKAEASQRRRRRRVSDEGGGESVTKAEASQR